MPQLWWTHGSRGVGLTRHAPQSRRVASVRCRLDYCWVHSLASALSSSLLACSSPSTDDAHSQEDAQHVLELRHLLLQRVKRLGEDGVLGLQYRELAREPTVARGILGRQLRLQPRLLLSRRLERGVQRAGVSAACPSAAADQVEMPAPMAA